MRCSIGSLSGDAANGRDYLPRASIPSEHAFTFPHGGGPSIALSSIQQYPDELSDNQPTDEYERHYRSELYPYEQDHETPQDHDTIYCQSKIESDQHRSSYRDEGLGTSVRGDSLQPYSRAESVHPKVEEQEKQEAEDSDYKPRSQNAKCRRRQSSQSSTAFHGSAQTRPVGQSRKASKSCVIKQRKSRKSSVCDSSERPFSCPLAAYNCHSTFTSKNEWKRHVSTQHVRLGFWRCDLCTPSADASNPAHNDFNRKDLFTQHLRRMHSHRLGSGIATTGRAGNANKSTAQIPEEVIANYQKRCYKLLREAPYRSSCLFCSKHFEGPSSWEERMEHVGSHMERDRKSGTKSSDASAWNEDALLHEWLIEEGLVEHDGKGGWKIGSGTPLRQKR
ncbi:hypothetical protein LTS18_008352 [Coniosporium uncinatum]|uniref:Uncharacterized protein n=1 Tax=Coniosporium uncinatum TaxID=93489 RepID=A0ACC3D1Y8_9PEZI|nr:hypothetical protein LTS18_008352 [Coniosporium uncinatum]